MLPPSHRGRIVLGLAAWLWLLSGVGPARSGEPVSGPVPSVALLVVPSDPAAQADAARVFMAASRNMHSTRSLAYVDVDEVLAGEEKQGRWEKARALFGQGRNAYDNLELDRAVELFEQAAGDLDAHLAEEMDVGLYTNIHVYWGSALVLSGRKKQGEKVYRNLLIFNSGAKLDPMVFPPSLSAVFNRVAGEVGRTGSGVLEVQASVEGTEVWVNGTFRGISPVRIEQLVGGEHVVRLVRRGYRSWGRKLRLGRGGQEAIRQGLEPLPGFERLEGLARQFVDVAGTARYPEAADELSERLGVDRLVVMLVGAAEGGFLVRAFYFDRSTRTRLKAQEKVFQPTDPSLGELIGLFCTSLYMDVGGQAIGGVVPDLPELPDRREEAKDEPSGSSWWLWTAIGVVAAGGLGLALFFVLGGDSEPGEGEVIFRF